MEETEADPGERRWPRPLGTLRAQLALCFVLLLLTTGLLAAVAVHQILQLRLSDEINRDLGQEVEELRALAREGNDPETGAPFTRIENLLDLYIARNIPDRDEEFLTFVDGEFYKSSVGQPAFRLEQSAEVVARFADMREPGRGAFDSAAGPVEFLAEPIPPLAGSGPSAVFAIFNLRAQEEREIVVATTTLLAVGAVLVLAAAAALWVVTGRVLAPVRAVTDTAREISETDLSRRIAVRGDDDEVSQLAHTFNAMLDRLEETFSTQRNFLNDAGHELRTPITIIRGHLELLGDDPGEREETVAIVTDELDRVTRFVDDLLLLAKVQRPDFLKPGAVDVGALTEEIAAKVQPLAPRRWALDATASGRIVADRQRLTQAVMQLAANAVQHTTPGQTVAIGSAISGGETRLWVRDTGSGIAAEDQQRIFERFARAVGPRRSEGTGLGLAIVRGIAEAHRGRVEVQSALGVGSTFTLILPHAGEPAS